MISVQFHTEAEAELAEAVVFYEAKATGLGASFLAEVKNSVALIQAYPEAPARLGPLLRKFVVKRFPYTIIYHYEAQRILVLAVAHKRRRPGYWKQR